jgi:hypothetical protein
VHRITAAVPPLSAAFRDAVMVTIACAVIGVTFNALRRNGIALIQQRDYQILVPCPVAEGYAQAIEAGSLAPGDPRILVIDARAVDDYRQWHFRGAINAVFDYLEPIEPSVIQKIASSGAQRVVVYGDGCDPDSGEQLAKELAGKGIRNVAFVRGGINRLKVAGGSP